MQTLSLGRIPYEEEVKEATLKEYEQQEEEACKPPPDYAKVIEDVITNTSEMGGRLARLEEMVRQVMSSLEGNSRQQHVFSSMLDASIQMEDNVGEAIEEDKAGEEAVTPNVGVDVNPNINLDGDPNAPKGLDDLGDVNKDALQDAVAEVNYLVENIGDIVVDKKDNVNTEEDVPPAATNGAPASPAQHASKNVEQSTRELNDPYSISMKEVEGGEQVSALPPTQMSTPQEVLYTLAALFCLRP